MAFLDFIMVHVLGIGFLPTTGSKGQESGDEHHRHMKLQHMHPTLPYFMLSTKSGLHTIVKCSEGVCGLGKT